MTKGFIADFTHGREQLTTTTWIEGSPEPSLWRGIKLKGKLDYTVETYRCTSCGYLESYSKN